MGQLAVVNRKVIQGKAMSLGYSIENKEEFIKSQFFIILDTETKTMTTTNSKKVWGECKQIGDEEFLRLPIPANEGDYVVERTAGEDIGAIFKVKEVTEDSYISTSSIDYSKNDCSRISEETYTSIMELILQG